VAKNDQVVIIKKRRKGGHGGHHGGAWKVAYADFVTAMMAFFLVMWIVGQSTAVKHAVSAYFRDPGIFEAKGGTTLLDGGNGMTTPDGGAVAMGAKAADVGKSDRQRLEEVAERIRRSINTPEFKAVREQIEIKVTNDGLRIELLETDAENFFDTGSDQLKSRSERLLSAIAAELGTLDNEVQIEGHTDSHQYSKGDRYTNWELSADRANAARRLMQAHGLKTNQIHGVKGYADTVPRIPSDRADPRNRRVSIVVLPALVAARRPLAADAGTAPAAAPQPAPPAAAPSPAPPAAPPR
jgi:chemotaxis protein MotB